MITMVRKTEKGEVKITGPVISYTAGDNVLIVRMVGGIEVEIRNVDKSLIGTLNTIGLAAVRNSVFDLDLSRVHIEQKETKK